MAYRTIYQFQKKKEVFILFWHEPRIYSNIVSVIQYMEQIQKIFKLHKFKCFILIKRGTYEALASRLSHLVG